MRTEFSFTLAPDEFARAVLHRTRKIPIAPVFMWPMQIAVGLFYACLGFLAVHGMRGGSPWTSPVFVAAACLLALWFTFMGLHQAGLRRACRNATSLAGDPRKVYLDEDGIRQVGRSVDAFHSWAAFRGIEEHRGLLYLLLDGIHFHVIPDAAFESPEERREFVAFATQRIAASRAILHPFPEAVQEQMPVPETAPATAGRIRPWRRMLDAFRLAFLRDVPGERMTGAWKHIFAFACATLALPIAVAFASTGWDGEWTWNLLPFALFHVPLVLVAAVVAAYAVARPADVPRFFLAGLMIAFAIDAVASLVQLAALGVPAVVAPAWLALAMATYVCRSIDPGVRRIAVAACCIVLVAVPLGTLYRERSPWHAPYRGDDSAEDARAAWGIAAEDAFYKQPQVLARELDALKPGRPGAVDVFFVGMAGYAHQDVFMREVDSVARLLRERFGAEGHTVRLVNNPKTLFDTPIATRTSLAASLKKIASVMDREEDVLVLFMTSHGSEKHSFSLSMWPLRLHEIDPKTLRGVLDESGIRNRVVVVSACYSGGFVDALRDDHTLVITASAPDRNSFGCSNEASWTYFGKAYFDEALRSSYSFIRAFELAKPAIELREKKDDYTPSDPRMSVGAKIVPHLERLEQQLRAGIRTAGAAKVPAPFDAKVERYVTAVFGATDMARFNEICRAAMRESSPEKWLEQDPSSFGGLDKSSKHWPRLAGAWETFAEDSCARANDPRVLRAILADQSRALLEERDIDAFLRFTATEEGRRWLAASRVVEQRRMEALAKVQDQLMKDGHRQFRDEQARIFADFQRDGKAKP